MSLQPEYSLITRDIERELLPLCREEGLAVLPWSPLAGGILSGKYRKDADFPAGTRGADTENPITFTYRLDDRAWNIVDAVGKVAAEIGKTPAQVALNWVVNRPGITAPIIGARNLDPARRQPRRGRLAAREAAARHPRVGQRVPARLPVRVHPVRRALESGHATSRVTGMLALPGEVDAGRSARPRPTIGSAGIVGDRQWALVDVDTGLALTARRQPELLFASAALDGDGVRHHAARRHDHRRRRRCSPTWLGHPVALTRADAVDHGTYEIALDFENEATAEWFQWDGPDRELPRLDADPGVDHRRRARSATGTSAASGPTCSSTARAEDGWIGTHGRRPATPRLDIVKPIDRCVITTRPQPGGIERDLDVLRTVNRDRAGNLGVGALVDRARPDRGRRRDHRPPERQTRPAPARRGTGQRAENEA